jgi:hypothetical protein
MSRLWHLLLIAAIVAAVYAGVQLHLPALLYSLKEALLAGAIVMAIGTLLIAATRDS